MVAESNPGANYLGGLSMVITSEYVGLLNAVEMW